MTTDETIPIFLGAKLRPFSLRPLSCDPIHSTQTRVVPHLPPSTTQWLDERSQRSDPLRGLFSRLLSAQPIRPGAQPDPLGARQEPGHGALGSLAPCTGTIHRRGQERVLLGVRGRRQWDTEADVYWKWRCSSAVSGRQQ